MYKAQALNRVTFTGKSVMMTSANNWLLDSQMTSASNGLLDSWTSANNWFLGIIKQLITWFPDDFGKQLITWFLDISKQLILGHQQKTDYLIPGRLRQTIDYLIPGRILIFQIMYRACLSVYLIYFLSHFIVWTILGI